MLHSVIVCAALFRDQLGNALWRLKNNNNKGKSNNIRMSFTTSDSKNKNQKSDFFFSLFN